jgi:hypothetical protein
MALTALLGLAEPGSGEGSAWSIPDADRPRPAAGSIKAADPGLATPAVRSLGRKRTFYGTPEPWSSNCGHGSVPHGVKNDAEGFIRI